MVNLIKKILNFIYNFVYNLYYIPLLFINFLLNLLIYPIFFCFFELLKFIILFIYHLTKLKYYFFVLLLNLILFSKLITLLTSNPISDPKLRRLFNKQKNFNTFFNDTNFSTSRKQENLANRNYYLKSNRYLYHFDYFQNLIESEDELNTVEVDLNLKSQRYYYINDFYRDEQIYLKLMAKLQNSVYEFDTVKTKLLLKKLLHNINFQSLTTNYSINHLIPKHKFPPNRSKLFLKYFNLFNSYTANNLETFFNFQFKYLNTYIRRRAYFLSQDYLNYDWFNYTTISLKDYLNFTPTTFYERMENVNFIQYDEHDDILDDEYNIDKVYKQDYIKTSYNTVQNKVFFNDFIFITLNYNLKRKFNLVTKAQYLAYFYKNYLYYFFKHITNNLLLSSAGLIWISKFLNRILYKILKNFYFVIYKQFVLISSYDLQDYPVLLTIKISAFAQFCTKKIILYYKIVKLTVDHFVTWYLCYPLLELNYVYVFIVTKSAKLLIYLFLRLKNFTKNLIKKFKDGKRR